MATFYGGYIPHNREDAMKFKKWDAECGIMSVLELRNDYGLECNLCRNFEEGLETCNKKYRLRIEQLRDGPNESCYIRKLGGCEDFEAREGVVGLMI